MGSIWLLRRSCRSNDWFAQRSGADQAFDAVNSAVRAAKRRERLRAEARGDPGLQPPANQGQPWQQPAISSRRSRVASSELLAAPGEHQGFLAPRGKDKAECDLRYAQFETDTSAI